MPTLFSRRYMRGKPRLTERLVGVLILLLLVFIVAAFMLTGGLFDKTIDNYAVLGSVRDSFGISREPLFEVASENRAPPNPSHEWRMAGQMLPEQINQWQRIEVEPFPLPEMPESAPVDPELAALAERFDSRMLYWASYGPEGGSPIDVTIADVQFPEAAFGLWRARQPEDTASLNLGRAGWIDQGRGDTARIGFWSGRYYTELTDSENNRQTLEKIARAIASPQLLYGGPFWAERILPREGRIEESFRYLQRDALGLSGFDHCFLADYQDGLTIAVTRPIGGSTMMATLREQLTILSSVTSGASSDSQQAPASASAVSESASEPADDYASGEESYAYQENQGESAESEEGYDGEGDVASSSAESGYGSDTGTSYEAASSATELESESESQPPTLTLPAQLSEGLSEDVAAGLVNGRIMVAFEASDYLFVVAGENPEQLGETVLALNDQWRQGTGASTTLAAGSEPEHSGGAGRARFVDVPGSQVVPPTRTERYAENLYEKINGKEGMFRAFHVVDLRFGQYVHTSRQQSWDVYLYDMAEPVNAMGIYMLERSSNAQPHDVGREGYISGSSVYFWKGPYYVNVLGPEGDEAYLETSQQIASAIAGTIADSGETFWADQLLPEENRIPHSFAYQATSALGYDFLSRMFQAKYEVDGTSFQVHLLKADSPEEASSLYDRYVQASSKYDEIVDRQEIPQGEQVTFDSLGIYQVVLYHGVYLGVVAECEDRTLAEVQAGILVERLTQEPDSSAGTGRRNWAGDQSESGSKDPESADSKAEPDQEGDRDEYAAEEITG